MELICNETYHDIRFTLNVGDSTSKIPFLTEDELKALLQDYPNKFTEVVKPAKKETEFVVETKEDNFKVSTKKSK